MSAVSPPITLVLQRREPEIEMPQFGSRNDTADCPFPRLTQGSRVIIAATIFIIMDGITELHAQGLSFYCISTLKISNGFPEFHFTAHHHHRCIQKNYYKDLYAPSIATLPFDNNVNFKIHVLKFNKVLLNILML